MEIEGTSLEVFIADDDRACDGCGRNATEGEQRVWGVESCCGGGCSRNLCRDCVEKAYRALFPAIDWKLKLMQVLAAVGEAEGVWFDPWPGVSEEEMAAIREGYSLYVSRCAYNHLKIR